MDFIQSYIDYISGKYPSFLGYIWEHLFISLFAIVLSTVLVIPLAIFLMKIKSEKIRMTVFFTANIIQTVPTVALLALMIPILGIGIKPAIAALFLYSIFPLLRNTFSGLESIDKSVIESARGIGYSTIQQIIKIEVPLAMPYIISGIRTTSVYLISWTTLAAVIGGGGLGDLILAGLGRNDINMILTGTLLAIIIAVLIDFIFSRLEKILIIKA